MDRTLWLLAGALVAVVGAALLGAHLDAPLVGVAVAAAAAGALWGRKVRVARRARALRQAEVNALALYSAMRSAIDTRTCEHRGSRRGCTCVISAGRISADRIVATNTDPAELRAASASADDLIREHPEAFRRALYGA